jgi:hypothetical protein
VSESDKTPGTTEGEAEVEGHGFMHKARHSEDDKDRGLSPEDRAGESRDDDDGPDVEGHMKLRGGR